DKLANLELALDMLAQTVGPVEATSRLYTTAPQYVEDQPGFLNLVARVRTALPPAELLGAFKSIEREIGRTQSIRWGPRLIDVDILLYDDLQLTMETAEGPLIVPHERIPERDFVLAPLCDLAPDLMHPVLELSMREVYKRLQEGEQRYVAPVPMLPVVKAAPWPLGQKTLVMGIVNVTPDSFSDGAELATASAAVQKALEMERNGVDIVDIGGESTRPGAEPVTEEEELRRVLPVIRGIREQSAMAISIDTTKAEVARQAVAAGANIVNDVSAGLKDPEMLSAVAKLRVPIVLMHMRGTPQTMTGLKEYTDVVEEVGAVLNERAAAAEAAGIFRWNVILDPGIGFAKARVLNLQLLRQLSRVKQNCHGLPLLVGSSRKGFIGEICGRPEPKDRAWGTAATCCAAIAQGADILRVHDGAEMVDVAKMSDAIWRGDAFGTEHLGDLLLDMGFNTAPKVLDRALDDMDPNATGEIAKLRFLEWFEENADEIDDASGPVVGSPSLPASPRTTQQQDEAYSELESAMLDAKNQRKQAEADAQLLANRLAHLRAEDARAQKRIEEAQRRAKEIEAVRKRNEDRQRAKQEAVEQLQREIKAACESNSASVASSRERRHQIVSELSSQRVQLVQETRAERQANLLRIRKQKELDRFGLVERSQEIREQEKRALHRRQLAQKSRHKELVTQARQQLAREHEKRLVSERKIHRMESEEAALIDKLRVTQELQRAAYEQLEFVMQDE
ncbi:hypothetical protein BBJ28_00015296, partial [Nothophytophthora sp. Chile5]